MTRQHSHDRASGTNDRQLSKNREQAAMIVSEYLGPYVGSNVISAALLFSALRAPRLTRVMMVVLFLAAALLNTVTAITRPESYLDFGSTALLDSYSAFIGGFFSRHVTAIIITIAAGQAAVALLLCGSERRRLLGVIGGVIFLLAIAPLGEGSAFPSTLLMAAALLLMHRELVRQEAHSSESEESVPEGRARLQRTHSL
jgi:hypothetical protein